jgi:predicted metal-dependent hydrolase
VPTTPEDIHLSPAESLREAQRLLDTGYPFHAHEVLEAAWKAAPEEERELWQGLAQLAVGLTHAERGNATGASRLLLRAAARIEAYAESAPHGIPAGALAKWARGEATAMPRLS